MTALNYVTITETFDDGSGDPATGTATFTPSQPVYAAGVPVVSVESPITVDINAGVLGDMQLLATDNADLTFPGMTGFFFWTVQVTVNDITEPEWSFFLPSSPGTVDLYSLARTGA